MLILVTTFKPFTDPFVSMIQENAIKSWKMLNGVRKIVVCGNDIGFEDICNKYNLIHEPYVKNVNNIPTIKGLFQIGNKHRNNNEYICYTNGDVIYTEEWIANVENFKYNYYITEDKFKYYNNYEKFLLLGRRFDWIKPQYVSFNNFYHNLDKYEVFKNGKYHPKFGIEYMIIDKYIFSTFGDEPFDKNLVVGSPGWDLLLLAQAIENKRMVVDLSNTTERSVIHQEHPRTFQRDKGPNFDSNMKLYRKKLKEFRQKYGIAIDMNIANWESYYDEDNKIRFREKENKLI